MANLKEKIGYGFGDMSSSMFWKIFSYYLPIFYADIFGLSLGATGMLMLVTRIWDTVSDPMMGAIADRTQTRWGKYRPYLLWMAAPFAISGCLLFTTPSFGESGKLLWAYATYILMMTVYTGINVPYGSMLGVMTDDSEEKTVFSSYRMFFAYAGSFIALGCWEPLVNMLSGRGADKILNAQLGWQHAMFVIAALCFCMFIICFLMTREHIKSAPSASIWTDLSSLVRNKPWWLLTAAALCTNLFNTLRGSTAAFYFKYLLGEQASINLGFTEFLFFAGVFLSIGEVCNMIGVACAVPFSNAVGGKKPAFIASSIALIVLSVAFFYVPTASNAGYIWILVLQVLTSFFTGVVSPLVWSMYADVADYSQAENGTASTGLIFSSGSMAQKFGGAIAGSAVMWILAAFGLVSNAATQTDSAILGMKLTMSYFPAAVAAIMLLILLFYPLNKQKMQEIDGKLKATRIVEG